MRKLTLKNCEVVYSLNYKLVLFLILLVEFIS